MNEGVSSIGQETSGASFAWYWAPKLVLYEDPNWARTVIRLRPDLLHMKICVRAGRVGFLGAAGETNGIMVRRQGMWCKYPQLKIL
jgi:hypothetical protein